MNPSTTAKRLEQDAKKNSLARRTTKAAERFAAGQLVLWPEDERGIPNELVRCALFAAKNRSEPRGFFSAQNPLMLPIIGGGRLLYVGDELRQDDETVLLQLFHMAKESRSSVVEFTGYSMLKAIGWPIKGASYERLAVTIRRLAAGLLEVHSPRFGGRISTRLIGQYFARDGEEAAAGGNTPWRVRVFDHDEQMLLLFDALYSRLEWQTRLALPDGIATWLHGFFSSHRDPFPHKVETLALGAGLRLEHPDDATLAPEAARTKRRVRLNEARRNIRKALESLVAIGFLESFTISRGDLVEVVRAAGR